MVGLDEMTRGMLDGPNFAVVATVGPDGAPHTSVVWIDRDGDTALFSTTRQRQKARNLAKDRRISISIVDRDDPYRSVEIRGTADLVDDPKRLLSKRLSRKYLDQEPPEEHADVERVVVRVHAETIKRFVA